MKLISDSAYELLALIDEYTWWDGDERPGSKLAMYWVPKSEPQYVKCLNRKVYAYGPGTASIIRGLLRKGFVKQERASTYSCSITEDGMLALEKYREAKVYVDGRYPVFQGTP